MSASEHDRPFPHVSGPLGEHVWIAQPDITRPAKWCRWCATEQTNANLLAACPGRPAVGGAPGLDVRGSFRPALHAWQWREFDHPDHPGDPLRRSRGRFCARCGARDHELAAEAPCPKPRTEERARAEAPAAKPAPVALVLTCPACGARHIDRGVWATKPHHTHACQKCGLTWRPAVVDTVGVRFLPGFKNAPIGKEPLQ